MTWLTEFPEFPTVDMPQIPRGFADASWHNDAMPCFISLEKRLAIWIDYVSPNAREFATGKRFFVTAIDAEGEHDPSNAIVLATDDWQAVLNFVV